MEDSVEYQILVGCSDLEAAGELVDVAELEEMVAQFFERNQVDFTLLRAKGGYLYERGWYVDENTLIVNLIGAQDSSIFRLAKSLAMFMSQEHVLVIRNPIQKQFR